MSYLIDYHMHSTYSADGHNTIMELCRGAVNKGISEIAVTDHFEPCKADDKCLFYNQKGYWADMAKARQAFKGKLKIKLGVELGQPHLFPAVSDAILADFPYDYVIASAHKLPEGMDVSEVEYEKIAEEDICAKYLGQLKDLVNWGNFNCIGHLDLIKRYSAAVYKKNISLACQYELLKEVFQLAIAKGKGIEINTSGLRQTPKETMPGLDVLRLYKELGGVILTTGSDAHFAEDVGKGLEEAVALASEAGFRFITVFSDRKPEWISITENKNTFISMKQTLIR
ncbi:MAG TPA: histidinol-phosphatase HisJ family protein [Candidatus Nitrosocosmicus sp.]|nr:histidinol-phosphatase HisJ family protein [Candidatus Nitrosocosmicus sp.]